MARMTDWSHRATFPAEAGSAGRAREFVRDRLVEHDLRYLVDDVRLVTSELATNATVHARTAFTIRLERLGGVVFLAVRDGSVSPPHTGDIDVSDTHGRGLLVVEQTSHDWGVAAGPGRTKSVWASFLAYKTDRSSV
jgi:anti-sigma regulatory factor (Ser/Thr protein kinase)